MTNFQKTVKYIAMAFAIFLTVSIIGGILSMFGLFLKRLTVTDRAAE